MRCRFSVPLMGGTASFRRRKRDRKATPPAGEHLARRRLGGSRSGVHGAERALLDRWPEGERSLPSVEGQGADEIAPVEGRGSEASFARSTGRRPWSGGCNGGGNNPLAKMSGAARGLTAHILRAVLRRCVSPFSAETSQWLVPAISETIPYENSGLCENFRIRELIIPYNFRVHSG